MSPQKLFFLFITYLLEDEQELSLGMLIHCKCIYNFFMLHAWFYPLSCVLFTLWSTFHMISWTNLLTRAIVPAACFLLFLVLGKLENEYSRNWTGQKPKSVFTKGHTEPEYETERGQGAATPPGRAAQPGPRQGVDWPPPAPPQPPLSPIRCL